MKELLLQYARYNIWANKRITEAILGLDEDLLDKEIESSFASARKTSYHIWGAEFIWLQRLQLTEQPVWIADDFKGSTQEACKDWLLTGETLMKFIEKQYDDKALEHVLQYYDRAKKSHKTPVYQVLLHVFNHSSYHRGQLVTMLRQSGQTKIPNMDFINYARESKG